MKIKARAHSNIALVKYWGKRDVVNNLPDVGSISVTLEKLFTETSVEFDSNLDKDVLQLNGKPASGAETQRMSRFLDLVRDRAKLDTRAGVTSKNNFPTSAGLASSASAFAALALAATRSAGLTLTDDELSGLARRGSGSAARSIFGGFVEMHKGQREDGSDATAYQLVEKNYWDIRILILITSEEKKKIGSTDGMTHSKHTSPYYNAWIESAPADLDEMRRTIVEKDFNKLGELSEFSCLKMHACAMASRPGILYWNSTTLELMHRVRLIREDGLKAYFTIDAGPQVKVICLPDQAAELKDALRQVPGVINVIETGLGDGAGIIGD